MHSKGNSIAHRLKTIVLNVVSVLFKTVSWFNLYFKSSGAQTVPGVFIVSVDNLSFGGTGKTSLVMELGRQLEKKGVKFAIVTRGYRSAFEMSGTEVMDFHTAGDVGDEARMFKDRFPRRGVYVGRDRENSIRLALMDKNRVILLDDGFQTTNIKKDFAVMLVNPEHPYYYLRNFKFMMKREDVVLVYKSKDDEDMPGGFDKKAPKGPRFGSYTFEPEGFRDGTDSKVELDETPVVGFSALGDNRRFHRELLDQVINVVDFRGFRDHHEFTAKDFEELEALRVQHKAEWLVCTEKDYIKIKPHNLQQIPFIYAQNSIKFNIDLVHVIIEYAEKKDKVQASD